VTSTVTLASSCELFESVGTAKIFKGTPDRSLRLSLYPFGIAVPGIWLVATGSGDVLPIDFVDPKMGAM